MLREEIQKLFMRRITSNDVISMFKKNAQPFRELMTYYKCAMMQIETKLNVLNEEFSLQYDRNPIESIKKRLKEPESIIEKMNRKNFPLTIESIENNIADIAGVRIVCSFIDDIYMISDCLLSQDDITLVERKDYIENPKEGGYRSLHLIVSVPIFLKNEKKEMKVEVQLRTIAMDFWASLEHKLRYKKNIPTSEAQFLALELLECANQSAQLDQRMQKIRERIAWEEE